VALSSPFPDAGTIYREMKDDSFNKRSRYDKASKLPGADLPLSDADATTTKKTLFVKAYEVHGNTLLEEAEIHEALKRFTLDMFSEKDIHDAAESLRQTYVANGYFAAVVLIPTQVVEDGVIRLSVYEGRLSNNGIYTQNSGARVSDQVLQRIIRAQLAPGSEIKAEDIERTILLSNDLSGITVSSQLYPGTEVGSADFILSTHDENLLSGNIDIDNFGSYFTGESRLGATLYVNSPNRYGEQITLRTVSSGSDSNYIFAKYEAPIGGDGIRVGASADYLDYELGKSFSNFDSEGKVSEYRLFANYPIIRSRHTNLKLQTSLVHTDLEDGNNTGLASERDVNSIELSLSGEHDDDYWASGVSFFDVSLTAGEADIKGNAEYRGFDRQFSKTDGSFAKLKIYLSRLQHIQGQLSGFVSLESQVSTQNLDSSQKFFLGGPYSVAGYPVGELSGDDAALMYVDLRYDLFDLPWKGETQVAVFYAYGWSKLFQDTWDNWQAGNPDLDNEITLQSAGLSVHQSWQDRFVLRAIAGRQIGDNIGDDPVTGKDSDNSDSDSRFWFQGIYYF